MKAIQYMELKQMEKSILMSEVEENAKELKIAMVIAKILRIYYFIKPLNNLDMKHSVQIMKVLRRLVDETGKPVVIVYSWDQICNPVTLILLWIFLKDGKIVKEGPTDYLSSCFKRYLRYGH